LGYLTSNAPGHFFIPSDLTNCRKTFYPLKSYWKQTNPGWEKSWCLLREALFATIAHAADRSVVQDGMEERVGINRD
jgi:hypothetical protein